MRAGVGKLNRKEVESDSRRPEVVAESAPRVELVPLDQIVVHERFTELDEERAKAIADTMRDGRLLQAIGLSSDGVLVWGRHRLRAAELIGWASIPARRMPYLSTDPRALIDQLDENLARRQLSAVEEASLLAKRKPIWEKLHPETRRGVNGGKRREADLTDKLAVRSDPAEVKSFAADAAEKTGKSPRSVRRAVEIGTKLDKDVVRKLSKLPEIADNAQELRRLSKLAPDMQHAVVDSILAKDKGPNGNPVRTVADALAESPAPGDAAVAPVPPKKPAPESAGDVLKRLLEKTKSAWKASCGFQASPQLGAAILESVAAEWLTQSWGK